MSQLIQSGGVQTETQLNQIVYLDFDGEYTSYNGEILNVDGVVVEDSQLSAERIAEIVAALKYKYASAGVTFVTERPVSGEYSTVYIGKTDDFDLYGNFIGLAETIDKGNANKSDNAFVILDSIASNTQIVDTISHETDHLLGTLNHGGEGLEAYASGLRYNITSGVTSTGITLTSDFMYISGSGVANRTIVSYGGCMYIHSGGVANSTTVKHSGHMTISNGGTANSTTVETGAMTISGGGVANSTTLNGLGRMTIFNGGTANSTTMNGANMAISSGGVANSTTVNSGSMTIFSGGVANSTTVNSGSMTISGGGVANSTTVNSGSMYISGGGVANSTTLNGLGRMTISSGGVANSTTINSGGGVNISRGGIANSTTINSGGFMCISAGGTANSTTVNDCGSMTISWDGIANSTTVNDCGSMTIEHGTANSTTINSGGFMCISSGGTANSTTVNSGGDMYIYDMGIATEVKENGGYVSFYSSYFAPTKVTFASNTISGLVLTQDSMTVHSNTIANSTTVNSGGDMYIYSAGIANNTTVNSGGDMYITSGGVHSGSLQMASGAFVSAYSGSVIDFTVSDRTTEDGYLINDLSLISGTPDYTITVSENQAYGTYKLAQGAAYFNKTITVKNATGTLFGKLTVNGTDFVYNGTTYSLNQVNDDLTLSIIDSTPPEVPVATVSTKEPTNKDVTVDVTYSSDSTVKQYKIGNGEWQNYSGSFTVANNATVYFRAEDASGNESVSNLVISNIDKVAPTLELTADVTKPTNGDVVLTATVSDGIVEYFDGENWIFGDSLTVAENGTYQFRVTDTAGNVTEKSVVVDNIDKVAPTIELTADITKPTNSDVLLTATVSDGTVEYFNGTDWITGMEYTVSENGTYQFRVTDEAGNVTEKSIEVSNIDKVAPTIELAADVTKPTNSDVLLTATVSDGTVEYFNGTDWVSGTEYTVSENGTYQFRVTDEAGNISEKSIEVTNIDKVTPTLEISGNPSEWTNQDVVLTASVNDGTVEYFDGENWISGNSLTVSENGTYLFRATDVAGNVTEKSVVVDKIDKISPTLEINVDSRWTYKSVIATAEFGDDLSGILSVEYSFDNQKWTTGTTALAENNGAIYWKATDNAGNVYHTSSLVSNIVTIDPEIKSPVQVYSSGSLEKDGSMFTGEQVTAERLMFVSSGGIASNTIVNGGTMAIYDDAKVTGVTLKNGGTINYYGGTAYNVELGYGGIMTIESGAVRQGQITDKGKMFVSNGGVASGAIIKNGGVQHVLSGGSADKTEIWLNGIVHVSSGAVVTDMVTKHGAKVHAFGGTISNTTMERGITSVYQGGKAVETDVGYGAYLMLGFADSGCSGVASSYDTVVSSGGGLTVMSGAIAEDSVIYGTLNCNNGGILLGENTIYGRANLAGNAVVASDTAITFDVSERSASAMESSYLEAMLNSYYVAREADMTISVSADQASGSYILANWALEAKKGTFTLEVDGTEVGTFSTTKSLTYDGKTYSLYCFDDATNSKALTLKVCDAVAMDAWTDLGTGDFDGDGIEESLVSDGTNLYAASEDLWLGNLSATEEIASITDYNNDGTDDLLIHNTATDQMTAWLVKDGTTYSTLAIA